MVLSMAGYGVRRYPQDELQCLVWGGAFMMYVDLSVSESSISYYAEIILGLCEFSTKESHLFILLFLYAIIFTFSASLTLLRVKAPNPGIIIHTPIAKSSARLDLSPLATLHRSSISHHTDGRDTNLPIQRHTPVIDPRNTLLGHHGSTSNLHGHLRSARQDGTEVNTILHNSIGTELSLSLIGTVTNNAAGTTARDGRQAVPVLHLVL